MSLTPLDIAIERIGLQPLSRGLGVTYQAVRKWQRKGLPRTEWTGETDYARQIEQLTAGEVTRDELLDWGRPKAFGATSDTPNEQAA